MRRQIALLIRAERALIARVRLGARVPHHMPLQVVQVDRGVIALGAGVWLAARVNSNVAAKGVPMRRLIGAGVADKVEPRAGTCAGLRACGAVMNEGELVGAEAE